LLSFLSEEVLKRGHQPMPEVPSLAHEPVGPRSFDHCFRNGTVVRSDDNDEGWVLILFEVLRGLHAVEARQVDIHQDQVGGRGQHLPQRLPSIGCAANQIEAAGFFQDLSEALQHEGGTIRYHGPDSRVGRGFCRVEGVGVHSQGLFSPTKKQKLFS
jgi:hypothetical protein